MRICDHFDAPSLDAGKWVFNSIGTPSIYPPERRGDSLLSLPELCPWNEGSGLLSRRFLGEDASVEAVFTGWDSDESGAGLGFYFGHGGAGDYVLLAITDEKLEIRLDSGAQHGAAFMDEGQPVWYVAAECPWSKRLPVRAKLVRRGEVYQALIDDRPVLSARVRKPSGDARAYLKALPWHDRLTPCHTFLDWAQLEGFAPTATLEGRVVDAAGAPVPGASVHLAGFDNYFVLADDAGFYRIENAPRGEQMVIAAAEGFLFGNAEIRLVPGAANRLDLALEAETRDNVPRHEYNNPAFDRSGEGWLPLNGTWQFCFDPDNAGEDGNWHQPGAHRFDRAIRVPFSWSSLMGFGEEKRVDGDKLLQFNPLFNDYRLTGEYGWYKRAFVVPDDFDPEKRTILHIGACTNVTWAWLDGQYLGTREDEYGELTFDLGRLEPGSRHTLVIKARFPHDINSHNMGKQIFWFASSPGIWQSVWLESRGDSYLETLKLRPELSFQGEALERAAILVEADARCGAARLELRVTPPGGGAAWRVALESASGRFRGVIDVESPVLWGYRAGNLYAVEARLIEGGKTVDTVRSYTGLRKVETRWLPGHSPEETHDPDNQYQYLYLNGKPFYVMGILDQGYNAFGVYTYRSLNAEGDEGARGSIAFDVDRTLHYGYNLSRMHIKENEPLWYWECDRRGLPVWTEHPGNFYATPDDPNWARAYARELEGLTRRLHNHPSIIILSTINESWGVEGRHVSTPWQNPLRADFLRDAAERGKALWPDRLICDNSGFGKTRACEINDYHFYPSDHWEAKAKWTQVLRDSHPGSIFNFINAAHGEYHVGDAVQTGRPVFISEFLHINGIDTQLRMFEKCAGYLRMNVGSHEVENSAPLTGERFERDYGYFGHDLGSRSYGMINNMDMVVFDKNRIERVRAGERFSADLYTSHFAWREVKSPILHLTVTGIDGQGSYVENLCAEAREIAFAPWRVEKQAPYTFVVPENLKGACVFAWVTDGDATLCEHFIQLEVLDSRVDADDLLCEISPADAARVDFADFTECFFRDDRSLFWGAGVGEVMYRFTLDTGSPADAKLIFEAGAHRGLNGIKVTDERKQGAVVDLLLDGKPVGRVCPKDDSSDERALFSNSAMGGEPFSYTRLGRFGYGERFEIELAAALLAPGAHTLAFRCLGGGLTLYGNRMGRYGINPMIVVSKQQ